MTIAQSASENNTKHVRDQVDKALYFIISAHLRTLAQPQYHSTILAQNPTSRSNNLFPARLLGTADLRLWGRAIWLVNDAGPAGPSWFRDG